MWGGGGGGVVNKIYSMKRAKTKIEFHMLCNACLMIDNAPR